MEHLIKHNLISEHQHGFLKGRTTITNLIETLDYWTHMLNEGENIDVVYCDFRKAFDSVPHERLMLKVRNYGIRGQLANWIEDFITEREQRVCISGKSSRWVKVTSGVPQGSVLGPLLFVMFINDLPECILSGVKMYADDTKIYNIVNNKEQAEKLQEEIDKLYNWSQVWQLLFHPDKCHILHLRKKSMNHEYYMGTDQDKIKLNTTEEEKDLGVTVDNKLTFSEHCNKIVTKANKILGIISRTLTQIDKDNFNRIYKGIVRPIVEYASSIYNPRLIADRNKIEGIQRRATKMVTGQSNKSYEERLRYLTLPTLVYRRARGDMLQVYRYLHKIYNTNSDQLLHLSDITHTRGHSLKLKQSRSNINTHSNFFTQIIVNLWNSLSEETVQSNSVDSFKNRLDKEWQEKPFKFNFEAVVE